MFFNKKCKITFIKHGSTINTEENRFFDDETFPPINENGKYEMEKISQWIKNKGLKTDKIYSSPSLRCLQSSRIIAEELKMDFEIIPDLSGRKIGTWSGMSIEEINQKAKDDLYKYYTQAETFCPEGAEMLSDFNLRIQNTLNEIINKNINKRIIIITHGDIIKTAITNALNIPLNHQFKIYIPTGSATQISYFKDFASLIYSSYIPI